MYIEIIFWLSVFFVFYAYFGYPLILGAISSFRNGQVKKGNITPPVSIVITAHNEEKKIKDKIENTLTLSYPPGMLEVTVASDCSNDKTDEIVRSYRKQGVRLVRTQERKGKENAQKHAIDAASGEIFIFSDVATVLRPDAILTIVKNFNDESVGCVSSIDKVIDKDGKINGEGAYVRYEMLLRSLESKVNSIVGLSGSFFAARKEVCLKWSTDLQSDFNTVLNSVKIGLRGAIDRDSIGYYHDIVDEKKEFTRKARTVLRGITVFMKNLDLLNFFKYGLFSWQLLSHKLCRWLVPLALAAAFVSNGVLAADSRVYRSILAAHCIFYTLAVVGMRTKLISNFKTLKIPSFFVLANLSIANAWYRYLRGERIVTWNPSKR